MGVTKGKENTKTNSNAITKKSMIELMIVNHVLSQKELEGYVLWKLAIKEIQPTNQPTQEKVHEERARLTFMT